MMYPFSFLFETPSTAFVTLGVGNVFLEMITTVTIFVLENSQEEDLEEVSAVCYTYHFSLSFSCSYPSNKRFTEYSLFG